MDSAPTSIEDCAADKSVYPYMTYATDSLYIDIPKFRSSSLGVPSSANEEHTQTHVDW